MTLQSILGLFLFAFFYCIGCSHLTSSKSSTEPSTRAFNEELNSSALSQKTAFVSHPDWIGLQLEPAGYLSLMQKVALSEGLTLKSRGEAHITVLTPPEFKGFQNKLTVTEIEDQIKAPLALVKFSALCVGRGVVKNPGTPGEQKDLKTYFVVVEADDLLKLRQNIKALALAKGTGQDFNPLAFAPHVTLGFTERDLHIGDGVVKDKTACLHSEPKP